ARTARSTDRTIECHSPSVQRAAIPGSSRLRRFERRTASARTRRVWIDDPKTGAGQTVGEIQGRAPQVGDAFVLYKKLHPIALDYCIAFFSFAKCHLVMQTGTAAFGHFYSQASVLIFRSL